MNEHARRLSLRDKLEMLFREHPDVWIPMRTLGKVGGIGGWRTRISELSRRQAEPMHIEWNGKNGEASCHRFRPVPPLGRAAETFERLPAETGTLFDLHPSGWQR